jgi:hypothetical protein
VRPADRKSTALMVALIALAAAAIGVVRPLAVAAVAEVKEKSDIYPLPPAEQLPLFTLGYRAAVADLIWADVLVLQGLRLSQRRRLDHGAEYFEAIFALEPTYRRPYLLVDSVLAFSATGSTEVEIRAVRRILEKGLVERPNDAQLFVQAGNFMAYIAPSVLPEAEHAEWRMAGARLLLRAAELGAGQQSVQWSAISGATLLSRAGEREAAVAFLERTFEVTEDPELRAQIYRQLVGLKASGAAERAKVAAERFEQSWRSELPFVSRMMILLLGPNADTDACAGLGRSGLPECARDWRGWAERSRETSSSE